MKKIILILFAVLAITACIDSDSEKQIEAQINSQILTNWFVDGNYQEIWRRLTAKARTQFPSFDAFQTFATGFNKQIGKPTANFDEHIFVAGEISYAERISTFDNLPSGTRAAFFWVLNSESSENIEQIGVRLVPSEATSAFDYSYQSKTEFKLPFDEQMVVLWGGNTTFLNYHADTIAQRFATDFVAFEEGLYFKNQGIYNDDHFCWGKPILAPALGKVVSVARSVKDNEIGQINTNLDEYLGNHVVLDHGNGEYSVLAHMRKGTVNVQLNEFVSTGDFIGECGNSGLSDIPHLHFHVQDSENYLDITGSQGIPATFHSLYIDGDFHVTKKIKRGERVSNDNK